MPIFGLSGMSGLGGVAGSMRIDPVAIAYSDALTAQSYALSSGRKRAISRFITSAKSHGYWGKLLDVGVLTGSTDEQACIKLYTTGSFPASMTKSGFTDAAMMSAGGVQGNGAGYFKTGVNANTFTDGIGGLSAYVLTDPVDTNFGYLGGVDSNLSTPYLFISTRGLARQVTAGWGGVNFQVNTQCARGFYQVRRTSLTNLELRLNDKVIGSSTTATTNAVRTADIAIMGGTNASSAVFPFRQGLGFYALDNGTLTSDEAAAMYNDVQTLMIALGRIVPEEVPMNFALICGQSLGVGQGSGSSLTTTSYYNNRMLAKGSRDSVFTTTGGLGKLVEDGSAETIASPMARQVGSMRRAATTAGDTSADLTIANYAWPSYSYAQLKKGTTLYNWGITSVTEAKKYSTIYNTSFRVQGIMSVHGESDANSDTYQADIETWQSDYETDIKAITGQTGVIPMFHSQSSSWQMAAGYPTTAKSPYSMIAAHKANPTKHRVVCPKYFFPYSDGIHLTAAGYRLLGEYYGKAWYKQIVLGQSWEPLRPSSVVRVGNTITVSFVGAVGNLVLDTTTVSDPGNYGFEWSQTGGTAQTISSVALSGDSTQVIVTLSGDPGTPTTQRLRYAYTAVGGQWAGPTTGPRGCVRDSDTTVGVGSGSTLVNWCVHFDEAVS